MNNNKSESYQKLRSLYEKKFIQQSDEDRSLGNASRIRFKNILESHTHSKHIDNALTFTQENRWSYINSRQAKAKQSITKEKRDCLHISLNYAQMQQFSSTGQYMPRKSKSASRKATSEGRREKGRPGDLKTLVLPNTSKDSLATPKHMKAKKYSLIQMIEQIKLMKHAGHVKIQMQGIDDGLNLDERTVIKYKDSFKSKQKAATHYYKSSRTFGETFRERKNSASHPKEDQIDPWAVSENEEEGKKYY